MTPAAIAPPFTGAGAPWAAGGLLQTLPLHPPEHTQAPVPLCEPEPSQLPWSPQSGHDEQRGP